MTEASVSKTRDNYYQELRGLCIIAVVMIHCELNISGDAATQFSVDLRQVINFPVAVFFFLSGMFLKKSNLTISGGGGERLCRLIIPYVLWSFFYLAIQNVSILRGHGGNFPTSISSWLNIIFLGGACCHLYFVSVLIQLTLFTPLMIWLSNRKWGLILCFCLTPLSLIAYYSYNIIMSKQLPFYGKFFPFWFIFYFMGFYYKKYNISIRISVITLVAICMFTFYLSMIESFAIQNIFDMKAWATSQVRLCNFMFTTAIIALILKCKPQEKQPSNWLSKIGDYAFGIYFMHMFVLGYAMKLSIKMIKSIPCTENNIVLLQYTGQIVTVVLTVMICYYILKFMNTQMSERQTKWFGIK